MLEFSAVTYYVVNNKQNNTITRTQTGRIIINTCDAILYDYSYAVEWRQMIVLLLLCSYLNMRNSCQKKTKCN